MPSSYRISELKLSYKKNILQSINPKIIITQSDHDQDLYNFKKYYGDKFKIIVIQRAVLGSHFKKFLKNKIIEKKTSIDYFFTFGNYDPPHFKKYLKGTKFFVTGNIKNNSYDKKTIIRKKSILFLSAWKPIYAFPKYEKEILKLLEYYCKIRKLKLVISTRFNDERNMNVINEFLNYKKHVFENRKNEYSVYKSICTYDLMVFCDQSIGYEAMSRGKKVLCFSPMERKYNPLDGSPIAGRFMRGLRKKEGKFWLHEFSEKKIIKKIDFISNLNKKKWNKLLKKEFNDFIIYDKKNKFLFYKLNKLGSSLKT